MGPRCAVHRAGTLGGSRHVDFKWGGRGGGLLRRAPAPNEFPPQALDVGEVAGQPGIADVDHTGHESLSHRVSDRHRSRAIEDARRGWLLSSAPTPAPASGGRTSWYRRRVASRFEPQHQACWSVSTAQVCITLALTCSQEMSAAIAVGTRRVVAVPSPSSPEPLNPQQNPRRSGHGAGVGVPRVEKAVATAP